MEKIEVGNETIFLKKGYAGWGVVHPIKNEDGSWNWKNFLIGGSWIKFFSLVGLIILILLAANEYGNVVAIANECLSKSNIIILP